jgi:hypothetical protein
MVSVLWLVLWAVVIFVGGGVARRVLEVLFSDNRLPMPMRA